MIIKLEECKYLIKLSEGVGYEAAKVNVGGGREKLITDYRKSDRCIIDSDRFAEILWNRIKHYIPLARRGQVAVGLNDRFRFLRYNPGDFFEAHRDGTYLRGMEKGPER